VADEPRDDLRLRLWARLAKRRDEDGFGVRNLRLKSGLASGQRVLKIDGGYGDGQREQKALLTFLESHQQQELQWLAQLRAGLPDLKSALALVSQVRSQDQIPALIKLFAQLKEEAVQAMDLLKELAVDEDISLQSSVLLLSGLEKYAATRDHLGDGLLSPSEFAENSRIYLRMRTVWTEEQARRGLSLILTPIADESLSSRHQCFLQTFEAEPRFEPFLSAWEKHWVQPAAER